jgi:hypothetical protein
MDDPPPCCNQKNLLTCTGIACRPSTLPAQLHMPTDCQLLYNQDHILLLLNGAAGLHAKTCPTLKGNPLTNIQVIKYSSNNKDNSN